MAENEQSILLDKQDQIAVITFNRPQELNPMNWDDYERFDAMVKECDNDVQIRAVIITGRGKAFSSGDDMEMWAQWDLSRGNEMLIPTREVPYQTEPNVTQRTNLRIMESEKVFVAAVNGICWLPGPVYACDFVVAAEHATFGQGDLRGGISPGSAESQTLPRILGRRRALEIMLLAESITAQEALRIGLVNRVVPAEELMAEAENLARKVIAYNPAAIKYTKLAVNASGHLPLREGLLLENFYCALSNYAGAEMKIKGSSLMNFGLKFLKRRKNKSSSKIV